MKILDLDPEIIVKVNISHCSNTCPGKLEKYLMEISGVYTVVIDPQKNMVTVRGKTDPMIVLNAITQTGHSAELLSYQKEPKIEEDEKWSKEKGKEHVRPRKHHRSKVEDYRPAKIINPDKYCKDPLCENHRRRPIITSYCVPPRRNTDHPRGFLCYHGNHPFDCQHPRIPSDSCGLHLSRPVHGFNNFTYFSDGYAGGCAIM